LLVSIFIIGYKSIERLMNPQDISGGWMLVMAVVAFAGNMVATKLLHDHAEESMNVKSAFLHSLQDALFSAGVILTSLLVLCFNWQWADAVVSLVLSILLAKEAVMLILQTVHVLMEGVPTNVDVNVLKKDLLSLKGIRNVNDLHVWSTGSKNIILSTHIVADFQNDADYVVKLKSIKNLLYTKYKITHSTIQMVPVSAQKELEDICKHCS